MTTKKLISGFFIEEPASGVLAPGTKQTNILNACKTLGTTDVFMYLITSDITGNTVNLQNFIAQLNAMGVNLWALNGDRSMFTDPNPNSYGFSELTTEIQAIGTYNSKCAVNEKITGLVLDLEPQDCTYNASTPNATNYVGFHNGLSNSQLSTVAGSGIYYSTQLLDRQNLMENWVQMAAALRTFATAVGIKLSMAMVNWTENYYGEPIQCYFNSTYQNVFYHFCNILDLILIMSYKSSISNLEACVTSQLKYTDTLKTPPLISAAYDVTPGDGVTVSLGDLPSPDNTKTYAAQFAAKVVADMSVAHPSFSGITLYDIESWLVMPS
jgi:hypothetical protein